jgi:hypothetical protein
MTAEYVGTQPDRLSRGDARRSFGRLDSLMLRQLAIYDETDRCLARQVARRRSRLSRQHIQGAARHA